MKLRAPFAALALVLYATSAFAVANVTSVIQKHFRNATSVAVTAWTSGDADSDAVVRIFQRHGGVAAFDTGMVMVKRTPIGGKTAAGTFNPITNAYSGRILWAPGNDTIDYYVQADDGNSVRTVVDTVTLALTPMHPTGGTNYYVNGTTGLDTYDGLSATVVSASVGPKKTIQAAVTAMAAANPASGSTINVANGEYHEQVTLTSGTNGRYFKLVGASRDSTIICAANPNVEAGTYDGTNPIVWTLRPPTTTTVDSVYAAYFPATAAGHSPADSTQNIVLGFGNLLHRKTSLLALFADSTDVSVPLTNGNVGEASGWFWQSDTLFVKSADGATPTVAGNHFGYWDAPLTIKARNWTIEKLSIRYAGSIANNGYVRATQTNPYSPGLNGHAITLGDNTTSATKPAGTVIRNCRLYGTNASLIYGPNYGTSGYAVDSVTVVDCILDGLIGRLKYGAGKSRAEENVNSTDIRGMDVNIYRNKLVGTFNGIVSGTNVQTDSTYGSHCEYSYNALSNIVDDAFELDTGANLNVLVYKNAIDGANSGFSGNPAFNGPIFIFYNTFSTTGRGAKLGGGNTAKTVWIHNTFYPDANLVSTPNLPVNATGGTCRFNEFYNNVFVSSPVASGTSPVLMPAAVDSSGIFSNVFNWNLYYCGSDSTNNVATWYGTARTLATVKSVLAQEANGRAAPGSAVAFQWPARYDFRLTNTASREISRGRRFSGINAAWGENRYGKHPLWSTTLPDLGASEYGYPLAEYVRRRLWTRQYLTRH